MALDTVADYVTRSRGLLQDTVVPYRYSDSDMVDALNDGIQEARRIRPDLFLSTFRTTLPSYLSSSLSTAVTIDQQYRMAFVYYMCGQMQMRDQEDVTDTRAIAFLNKFSGQLVNAQG